MTAPGWFLARGWRQRYAARVTNTLECVDSTLAPAAISRVVQEAYATGGALTCELIQQNLDATYLLAERDRRHLARLYNSRWWSLDEILGEIEVLEHLAARDIRVAAPTRRKDGGWVTTVRAPEGPRQLVVYRYVEGEGLLPSRDARQFGEVVGRMHRVLQDLVTTHRRRELTWAGLIRDGFDAVLAELSRESEHRPYLESLLARVVARAEELGIASFREGFCHGDLNFSNATRQADGGIALYDFETCGRGLLAYDLAVFRWTQQAVGAPERAWQDFVDGYRSENELPARELAAMELLVLLRQAYMLGYDARRSSIGSLGTRWRHVLRPQKIVGLRALDAQLFGTEVATTW